MQFNLELPINSTSFGQVSTCILREIYARGLQPNLFPIGQVDLQSQQVPEDFGRWLQSCINKGARLYKRSQPTFRLWHLNGSHSRLSDKTVLLTFYETDNPTETELNIIKNTDKVLFTSNYTAEVFRDYGADNVGFLPLAFDKWNFGRKATPYLKDKIVFNIVGKFEHRKRHEKVVKTIVKKWGNDGNYHFQLAIYNPFFKPEDNQKLFAQLVEGKNYWNVQFLGFMPQNQLYNDYLNSANVILGMSGGENWGLPEFHSVAMGKHAVIHNCGGYKEWANNENSVLVNSNSKIPAYDGAFFQQGAPFNQGNFFEFDEDAFIAGVEKAIERVKINPVNTEGLKLQDKFTWEKIVDQIIIYLHE